MQSKFYVPDPLYPRYPARSDTVKMLLGLRPADKLPEAGMPPQYLPATEGTVKVWVAPLVRKANIRTSVHRVLCECPKCNTTVSIGRLAQHVCGA